VGADFLSCFVTPPRRLRRRPSPSGARRARARQERARGGWGARSLSPLPTNVIRDCPPLAARTCSPQGWGQIQTAILYLNALLSPVYLADGLCPFIDNDNGSAPQHGGRKLIGKFPMISHIL